LRRGNRHGIDSGHASSREPTEAEGEKEQRSIHFVSESDSRRKSILAAFAKIEFQVVMFIVKGQSDTASRRACLDSLIEHLDASRRYSLVLDVDETILKRDRQALNNAILKRGMKDTIEYRHSEPHLEPLLWIPDALAWTLTKKGDWSSNLSAFNIEIRNLD
jgi:hypothetical protein